MKNTGLILYQTYSIDAVWARDVCFTFWGQKVKVQGHRGMICWKCHFKGGSIQYLTSHLEFRVPSYYYFAFEVHWLFILAELARDSLERTGKYEVIEGIISPVSDSYPKKVCYYLQYFC